MLKQLQNYYDRHGILATNFACRYSSRCSASSPKFTGPKSAYVSTGYESGELPRLLFLSLDSGSAEADDLERMPLAVRRQEEIERAIWTLPKGRHWFRTHELAWYVLRKFKPDLQLDQAKHYFAHANSAKCCMNNDHNSKASSVLFQNCRGFLRGELEILDPNLVVTQGQEAKEAMSSLLKEVTSSIDQYTATGNLNGKRVYWLHTYHPNNYGRFNPQRAFNKETQVAEGFERYATAMREFISASKYA